MLGTLGGVKTSSRNGVSSTAGDGPWEDLDEESDILRGVSGGEAGQTKPSVLFFIIFVLCGVLNLYGLENLKRTKEIKKKLY